MNAYEDCFQGIDLAPSSDDHYTATLRFRDPTTGQELTEEWHGARITDMAVTENGDLTYSIAAPIFPNLNRDMLRLYFGDDEQESPR